MGIYIIRAKDGPVKIGYTENDPHKRIANIKTAHWAKLELVAFMDGDRKAEKALHRKFAAARLSGEWFEVTPELEAFIQECPKPNAAPTNKFMAKGEEYVSRARKIWFDMSIPSNNQAAKIAGVHYHVLRFNFGPSGRETRDVRELQRKSAIDTARKRTDDGRCSPERLFELWGSRIKTAELVSKSGWPQATIYKHFARLGITREQAGLEMTNRRKAKRRKS